MVGPPMIRPLYPPSASSRGKKPSTDGTDVIALKRAVSRSGHWPWQPFDDAFSNRFAHGASGNVSENGLAGLQRQNGIDDTGWMGEHTYNLIRSALIPDGLPHAGEHILDATSVEMLNDFARRFAGGSSRREQALAHACSHLGYSESPPETNGNMYGAWYGMNFEPWCAMFVAYCFEHAGGSPSFAQGECYSYVPYLLADALAGRNGLELTTKPIAGDLVVYDWHRDGEYDHVGFFERGDVHDWDAIEGNTSTSNDSNGGQVMRRQRRSSDGDSLFIRVRE